MSGNDTATFSDKLSSKWASRWLDVDSMEGQVGLVSNAQRAPPSDGFRAACLAGDFLSQILTGNEPMLFCKRRFRFRQVFYSLVVETTNNGENPKDAKVAQCSVEI